MITEGRHPVNQPLVSSNIREGSQAPLSGLWAHCPTAEWTMKTLSLPAQGCDSQAPTLGPR